jgi:hypothetical protein
MSERRNVGNIHNVSKPEFALVSRRSLQSRLAGPCAAFAARFRRELSELRLSSNYWFIAFSAILLH